MKKSTKLMAILLILVLMVASFAGCGKVDDDDIMISEIESYVVVSGTGNNTVISGNESNGTSSGNESNGASSGNESNGASSENGSNGASSGNQNNVGTSDKDNNYLGSKSDLLLYEKVKLNNYVELSAYKGIVVDTKGEEFKKYYDKIIDDDVEQNNLYKETNTVENGFVANIDFVGKMDGVAFDGGTGKEYDLKIGSGTFIDNFEEQLIGVKVGETKDVVVTFPSDYGEKTLAGKEAVFTVKVNSIGSPMAIEESYEKMGFASAEKYNENITSRAVDEYLLNYVCSNAKIKDYPADDKKLLGDAIYNHYADIYAASGSDFQQLLQLNGMTVDQFKEQFSIEFMKTNMVMYYIFNAEGLEMIESTLAKQEVSEPVIAESYAVHEIVISHLYENAEIK